MHPREALQREAKEEAVGIIMKKNHVITDIDHDFGDDSYVIRVENPEADLLEG